MVDEQQGAPVSNDSVKQKNLKTMAVSFGVVVAAVVVVALGVGIFRVIAKGSTDGFSRGVAKVLRLPVAKVNGETILFNDYARDLDAIKKVREYDVKNPRAGQPSAGTLTDEELSDQVLLLAASNILATKMAQERGLSVTDTDLKQVHDGIVAQLQTEAAVEQEVMDRYGWTYAQYEQYVVRPALLKNKVAEAIATDIPAREVVQKQAQDTLNQIKAGGNFEELAKQYSDDGSGRNGGRLEPFGDGVMYPTFEEAVKKLKKGELAQTLVETQYGFHIIKLNDLHKKGEKIVDHVDEQGKPVYRLDTKGKPALYAAPEYDASHILFMYPNINKELNEQLKKATIHLYSNVHNPFVELTKASN